MTRNGKLYARGSTPPNNIGPRATPNYRQLAAKGVVSVGGARIFAGQRDDPFFGDIGSIFDLLAIRKGTGNMGGGKDFFAGYAVHSIALQIPVSQLGREEQHDRRLVVDRPPQRDHRQQGQEGLDAGLAHRQPAGERGRRPDAVQGPLEPVCSRSTTSSSRDRC